MFNGFDFKNYNLSNGFPSHGAFTGEVDENGRIWFLTFNDSACYYEHHSFHRFKTPYNVSWILTDKSDIYFLTTAGHVLWYKNYKLYKDIKVCGQKLYHGVVIAPGKLFLHSPMSGMYMIDADSTRKVNDADTSYFFTRFYKFKNGDMLFSNSMGIFELVGDGRYEMRYLFTPNSIINYEIFSIADNGHELWICTTNGLYVCNDKFNISKAKRVYDNGMVTSVIYDIDSNFWFSTRNDGMYTFRQSNALNRIFYNNPNTIVNVVTGSRWDSVYFFCENGEVKRLQRGQVPHLKTVWRFKTTIRKIMETMEGYYVDCLDDIYNFPNVRPSEYRWMSFHYKGFDSAVYFNTDSGFIKVKNGVVKTVLPVISADKYKTYVEKFGNLAMKAVAARNDTFWVGNERGLLRYTPNIIDKPFKHIAANTYVADIKIDREGIIWVATKGRGVYYIKDNRLYIPADKNMERITCNALFIDAQDNIWAASQDGLFKIIKSGSLMYVKSYNYRSLLPAAEVRNVFKTDSLVFVNTNKGVNVFVDKENILMSTKLTAFINNMYVNNKSVIDKKEFSFRHNENNIRFEFTCLDFSSLRRPTYYYCLRGKDSVWVKTELSTIDFTYLQPGNYTFYVKAENMDGMQSNQAAKISFIIMQPFWQRDWFYILCIIAMIWIVVFFIGYNRKVNRRKREFIETELKALRAQMNPHFIFNTLNAIQDFILQNDKSSANYYLVKFSTLMRTMLENSKKNFISLEQEINFLELYLEIEAFRFNDKFSYSIAIDPAIGRSGTYIPSMILQPFIENAINHGLMPNHKQGRVTIFINKIQADLIKCTIEDNGVGRTEKARVNLYESTGILTTESRLRLLNRNRTDSIIIIDLKDEHGAPAGTLVEIWINTRNKT